MDRGKHLIIPLVGLTRNDYDPGTLICLIEYEPILGDYLSLAFSRQDNTFYLVDRKKSTFSSSLDLKKAKAIDRYLKSYTKEVFRDAEILGLRRKEKTWPKITITPSQIVAIITLIAFVAVTVINASLIPAFLIFLPFTIAVTYMLVVILKGFE